jgi:hypothetical protein
MPRLTIVGDQCFCGNDIPLPTSGTCDRLCEGNSNQVCGGNHGMSVYVIVSRAPTNPVTGPVQSTTTTVLATSTGFPVPTSTGNPVCNPGSPFDGTVNDNYLILCDTSVAGSDLNVLQASELSDCISKCRSYAPESQKTCVAVEYDSVSRTALPRIELTRSRLKLLIVDSNLPLVLSDEA